MGHSDARNLSLTLSARGLPVDRGHVFVLWANDDARSRMLVGNFMVDRRGACRVRFKSPQRTAGTSSGSHAPADQKRSSPAPKSRRW
jgi:hypothetical protein